MIIINCFNPKCQKTKFEWNEQSVGGIGPGNEGDKDAYQFPATCPYCGTDNYVWIKIGGSEEERQKSMPHCIFRNKE